MAQRAAGLRAGPRMEPRGAASDLQSPQRAVSICCEKPLRCEGLFAATPKAHMKPVVPGRYLYEAGSAELKEPRPPSLRGSQTAVPGRPKAQRQNGSMFAVGTSDFTGVLSTPFPLMSFLHWNLTRRRALTGVGVVAPSNKHFQG